MATKINATIVAYDSLYCYFNTSDNQKIQMRISQLENYSFEGISDESGRPSVGEIIHLVGHYNPEKGKTFYSPDQQFHKKKNVSPVSKGGIPADQLLIDTIPYDPLPNAEGPMTEFKSSVVHSPNTARPQDSNYANIITALVAMGNTKGGEVQLGRNNDGSFCGIENELTNEVRGISTKADFIAAFANRVLQATGDRSWVNAIQWKWYLVEGQHILLRIIVPKNPEPVYMNGRLYVRNESINRLLTGRDATKFITDFNN